MVGQDMRTISKDCITIGLIQTGPPIFDRVCTESETGEWLKNP